MRFMMRQGEDFPHLDSSALLAGPAMAGFGVPFAVIQARVGAKIRRPQEKPPGSLCK